MAVGKRPRIHCQIVVEPEIVGKCAEPGTFRNFHEGSAWPSASVERGQQPQLPLLF